jgi:hypothetical protein
MSGELKHCRQYPCLPVCLLPPQVKERKSELARLETLDMGKPIAEAEWDMDDVGAAARLGWVHALLPCHTASQLPL